MTEERILYENTYLQLELALNEMHKLLKEHRGEFAQHDPDFFEILALQKVNDGMLRVVADMITETVKVSSVLSKAKRVFFDHDAFCKRLEGK